MSHRQQTHPGGSDRSEERNTILDRLGGEVRTFQDTRLPDGAMIERVALRLGASGLAEQNVSPNTASPNAVQSLFEQVSREQDSWRSSKLNHRKLVASLHDKRRSQKRWLVIAPLAAACAALVLIMVRADPSAHTFTIDGQPGAIGQTISASAAAQRRLTFPSGTQIDLGKGTVARVAALTSRKRQLALDSGQINAQMNAPHRWNVRAGPFAVVVSGTKQFGVSWENAKRVFTMRLDPNATDEAVATITGPNGQYNVARGRWLRVWLDENKQASGRIGEPVPDKPRVATPVASITKDASSHRSQVSAAPTQLAAQGTAALHKHATATSPSNARAEHRAETHPPVRRRARSHTKDTTEQRESKRHEEAARTPRRKSNIGTKPSAVASVETPKRAAAFSVPPARQRKKKTSPSVWTLLKQHNYPAAVTQAKPKLAELMSTGNATQLLALGDAARYARSPAMARTIYLRIRSRFSGSDSAAMAAFALGRLAGKRAKEANTWFDKYLAEAPMGRLAALAYGRKLEALWQLQKQDAACHTASIYLTRFAGGAHAKLAQQIADGCSTNTP